METPEEQSQDSLDILNDVFTESGDTKAEETQEEVQETAQEETTEVPSEEETPELIVDDELIEQYSTLLAFKGKPLTEVAKSYDNVQREYKRLQTEMKKAEKADNEVEKEDETENIPDPYDNPKEFKKWLVKTQKEAKEAAKLEALEEIERKKAEADELSKKQAKEAKEFQENVTNKLSASLKGIDPKEAIDAYVEANKELLIENGQIKPSMAKLFTENPDFLVKSVVDYVHLVTKDDTVNTRVEAFEMAKKGLQSSPIGELASTTSQRDNFEMSEDDKLVQNIIDLNTQND